MRGRRYKKATAFGMAAFMALTFSGCGSPAVEDKAQVKVPIYNKIEYNAAEVVRGDVESEISLHLHIDGLHRVTYSVDRDDLEIDKIYVSEGDAVKKGDVLVSFKSGDIADTIKGYQKQLEDDRLIMDHYKRLIDIEKKNKNAGKKKEKKDGEGSGDESASVIDGYKDAIADIEKEMRLIKIQIEEANERLRGYSLIAEEDGSIDDIDEGLLYGYIVSDTALITEYCGSGNYVAVTKDDFDFEVGAAFEATIGVARYDMKLKSIEAGEKEGERQLIFEPLIDMSGVSNADTLTITVKKPVLKDVVYISTKSLYNIEEDYFVYVMDEDGFRNYVKVTVGETIGEKGDEIVIITSGLEGGEQVMVR